MMNELESCDGDDEISVVNTKQRVQDALTSLDTVGDEVIITSLPLTLTREAVSNFMHVVAGEQATM